MDSSDPHNSRLRRLFSSHDGRKDNRGGVDAGWDRRGVLHTANIAAYFVETDQESDIVDRLRSLEQRQERMENSLEQIRQHLTRETQNLEVDKPRTNLQPGGDRSAYNPPAPSRTEEKGPYDRQLHGTLETVDPGRGRCSCGSSPRPERHPTALTPQEVGVSPFRVMAPPTLATLLVLSPGITFAKWTRRFSQEVGKGCCSSSNSKSWVTDTHAPRSLSMGHAADFH